MSGRVSAGRSPLLPLLLAAAFAMPLCAAVPEPERNALIALHQATNGGGWNDATGWLGAAGTECNWFGVVCDGAESHVIELALGENALRGPLPPSLADLSHLEHLYLWSNELSGTVPPELGTLSRLTELSLEGNTFTGAIPSALGNLTALESLNLAGNRFAGAVPESLVSLVALRELRLDDNDLTGTFPSSLPSLAQLEHLDLSRNDFSGPLPSSIGSMTALRSLLLSENGLTGEIPPGIFTLPQLEQLYLDHNSFSGLLPDAFDLPRLIELSLAQNDLGGTVPSSLSNSPSLQLLDLAGNALEGPLPPSLALLTDLRDLYLGGNRLSGAIPSFLAGLQKLEFLDLAANRFSGTIPASLGELKSLSWLWLGENELTGPIPPELGSLPQLRELHLCCNRLSGPIPSEVANVETLTSLSLGDNPLTGGVPPELMELTALTNLDLAWTLLTGSIPAVEKLLEIEYLNLEGNQFSGTIPPEIGNLTRLVDLRLGWNRLSGPIPPSVGNLTRLETLLLGENDLSRSIPPEIGSLTALRYLGLGSLRLSGAIPSEIGQLTQLLQLDLASNRLEGEIPRALLQLDSLQDGGSDFRWNALRSSDPELRTFVARKQMDGGEWETTQTLPPPNVRVTGVTDRSITLAWTPAAYVEDEGGYQIRAATPEGTLVAASTTTSKEETSGIIRGLTPETTYTLTVRTITHPHGAQKNLVASAASSAVSATTAPRVASPADVAATSWPGGLVRSGDVATSDAYVLANFGDVPTTITLEKDEEFFEQSPSSFVLQPGSSQTITLTSLAVPEGTYWGSSTVRGEGVPEDLTISVHLLVAPPPSGSVAAVPLSSRIELFGEPETDSVGTVAFRNTGTVPLSGIIVADVPWIDVDPEVGPIAPGGSEAMNFRVVRSKRPQGSASEGSVSGSLSLLYASAATGAQSIGAAGTSSISVSRVSVVDTARRTTTTGSFPPLASGEIALIVSGIVDRVQPGSKTVTDIALAAPRLERTIDDLTIYFASTATSQVSSTSLSSLKGRSSVAIGNVARAVGGTAPRGIAQIRSRDASILSPIAFLTTILDSGARVGEAMPLFRSDRAAAAGEAIVLPGVESRPPLTMEIFLAEASGAPARAQIDFLDASGVTAGASGPHDLAAFGAADVAATIPSAARTAIVSVAEGSEGRVVAFARASNPTGSESWSVVDSSRQGGLGGSSTAIIPLIQPSERGRRRPVVRPAASKAAAAAPDIEVVLFNSGTAEGSGMLRLVSPGASVIERRVVLPPRHTLHVASLASWSGRPVRSGRLEFLPARGRFALSAFTLSPEGRRSSALPVTGSNHALTLGQSRTFAAIEDSTRAAATAGEPGTFTTSLALLEMTGAPATVRLRTVLHDGRSLVATRLYRDIRIGAGSLVLLDHLVESIVGPERETAWENLHELQLEVELHAGAGSVIPVLVSTENASGDTIVRID